VCDDTQQGWSTAAHRKVTYFVKDLPEGRSCLYITKGVVGELIH